MRIFDDYGQSKKIIPYSITCRKFDLEGIGSIATRQLIDQLGLTEEGIPKKETIKLAEYKFPASHRAEYKNFSGHNPLLVWKYSTSFAFN